jgi:hypothetical protein
VVTSYTPLSTAPSAGQGLAEALVVPTTRLTPPPSADPPGVAWLTMYCIISTARAGSSVVV